MRCHTVIAVCVLGMTGCAALFGIESGELADEVGGGGAVTTGGAAPAAVQVEKPAPR